MPWRLLAAALLATLVTAWSSQALAGELCPLAADGDEADVLAADEDPPPQVPTWTIPTPEPRVDLPELERPQPFRAAAWIMAEQAVLIFNLWAIYPPPDWNPPSVDNFVRAWTTPPDLVDDDHPFTNLVLHPLMGAHFYMAARNHGMSPLASFGFSAAGSFVWEYVVEPWWAQPSVLDLLITPIAGASFAMLVSQLKRPVRRIGPRFWRGLAMIPLDPIEGFDILLFRGPPRQVTW